MIITALRFVVVRLDPVNFDILSKTLVDLQYLPATLGGSDICFLPDHSHMPNHHNNHGIR